MVEEWSREENVFLKAATRLLERHVSLKEFSLICFSEVLGSSSTHAAVYFLGDDAFADPRVLLIKLKQLFASGTPVLLSQFVERANSNVLGKEAVR